MAGHNRGRRLSFRGMVNLASWGFWALGIAGYAGVSVPMLTSPDAFLYVSGNELEGGWGFNYAMVIAAGLTAFGLVMGLAKRS